MTRPNPYHEINIEALPAMLCTADPMRPAGIWAAVTQRLNDLGVHEIDLRPPSPQSDPPRGMTQISPDLLCTDDPMLLGRIWAASLQRLGGLGVRTIDVALPPSQPDAAPSPSQTKPALPSSQTKRKRHAATAIKRIEKATGKVVTGVTLGDDGRVASYTFAEASATETNPSEAEADKLLEQWKRKKNAN